MVGFASCIKHFAAYGAPEAGREYAAVDMGERKLRQEFLRPYQAAVEAGARMVMPAFNTFDGIPCTGNQWLLRDVLEGEWGFDGVKVSDYAAIKELTYHGFAEGDVLPLAPGQHVALVGAHGSARTLCGLWAFAVDTAATPTLAEEMGRHAAGGHLAYAWGADSCDDYDWLGSMAAYFPHEERDADEELAHALEVAEQADVVVCAVGEHMLQSGEAASRTDLSLPACQLRLLRELRVLDKPLVAVVYSGRPLLLAQAAELCDAVVQAWWPGTEGSAAIADVLYGAVNPSGRLAMSVPRTMGQIPVYYGQLRTGRPLEGSGHGGKFVSRYLDCPNTPLYPFGHGLSYTDFELRDLEILGGVLTPESETCVEVTLANTGERKGTAMVQLYIQDVAGSVARPSKELVDFRRVELPDGEARRVRFAIREPMLRAYDVQMRHTTEPGTFKVFVGLSSDDCLEGAFEYVP